MLVILLSEFLSFPSYSLHLIEDLKLSPFFFVLENYCN